METQLNAKHMLHNWNALRKISKFEFVSLKIKFSEGRIQKSLKNKNSNRFYFKSYIKSIKNFTFNVLTIYLNNSFYRNYSNPPFLNQKCFAKFSAPTTTNEY